MISGIITPDLETPNPTELETYPTLGALFLLIHDFQPTLGFAEKWIALWLFIIYTGRSKHQREEAITGKLIRVILLCESNFFTQITAQETQVITRAYLTGRVVRLSIGDGQLQGRRASSGNQL